MSMNYKCGYVLKGEHAGKFWAIDRIDGKEHYVLKIDDAFYASADNPRVLLDEVSALDGLNR